MRSNLALDILYIVENTAPCYHLCTLWTLNKHGIIEGTKDPYMSKEVFEWSIVDELKLINYDTKGLYR